MSASPPSPIVAAAGGSFLLETRTPAEVFTPEDLNEEQRQIAATAAQFARDEILPLAAAIEAKQPGVIAGLMRKAGELGFTAVNIPEEYGGVGVDKTTSTLITDHLSVLASGEWIGGYGLSEAGSGSDGMNILTWATLSADGAAGAGGLR
jgi:butyryl-CoA dehydrogenase